MSIRKEAPIFVIEEPQIKLTVRCQYILTGVVEIQKNCPSHLLAILWSNRSPHSLLVGIQNWWIIWHSLIKPHIVLPYNPAVVTLGMYPNELTTDVHTRTCT